MSRPGNSIRLLALWSVPRSRSTAFFRVMAERGDFAVVHEPFSYLAEFGECRVADEIVASQPALINALRSFSRERPVFFKDTTDESYLDVLADDRFLRQDAVHTFLIRHPLRTIASYHAINPGVKRDQIGFESLYRIYDAVRRAGRREPVVLDGDQFAAHPEATMRAYCERLGLDHDPATLSWSSGERPEWAPSARWHRDVNDSTGVHARHNRYDVSVADDPVLSEYLHYHLPFYEELRGKALPVAR